MKKLFRLLEMMLCTVVLVLFCTCTGTDEPVGKIDVSLLYGTWQASDGYTYIFNDGNSGRRQDSAGHGFDTSWDLSNDELTIKYLSNGSGYVSLTEIYVIRKLTVTRMEAYEMTFPDETVTFAKR